jgi:hypothetical protein
MKVVTVMTGMELQEQTVRVILLSVQPQEKVSVEHVLWMDVLRLVKTIVVEMD